MADEKMNINYNNTSSDINQEAYVFSEAAVEKFRKEEAEKKLNNRKRII